MTKKSKPIKIGLFGIGLDTYWAKFDGLLLKLKGYQDQIKNKILDFGVELVDAGMVDNELKAGNPYENIVSSIIASNIA